MASSPPKLFEGKLGWFAECVPEHFSQLWVQNGGEKIVAEDLDPLLDDVYAFSNDPTDVATEQIMTPQGFYLDEGGLIVLVPQYIEQCIYTQVLLNRSSFILPASLPEQLPSYLRIIPDSFPETPQSLKSSVTKGRPKRKRGTKNGESEIKGNHVKKGGEKHKSAAEKLVHVISIFTES
jgi:hypothetical protein